MQNTSDQNILSLLQTDPSKGMELLMDKYIGLLWGACSICLDNTEDIRDCIQDTLLDFYEHFSRFDLENGSLKAYLYVIAKRKAMRMTLKNGKYADLDDLSEDALSEDDNWTEAILTQNILDEAIAKLHPQDGEMIRLKYYNGMTCA